MEKLKQKLADLPIRRALLRFTLIGSAIASALILIFLVLWNTLLNLWDINAHWTLLGLSAQVVGITVLFGGAILGSFLILAVVMHKIIDKFYQLKLAQSLEQLNYGINQIKTKNLDFELHYTNHDELGLLTQSFESMRLALQEALQQSWRLLEDQKEVNAAFAHDLRTPLTVLQGDVEMLSTTINDDNARSLVQDLQTQLSRVTEFVNLMSKITSLQTAPVDRHPYSSKQLESLAKFELSRIINGPHIAFNFQNQRQDTSPFNLSTTAMLEVFDNQLANAQRFAKSNITITFTLTNKQLELKVVNDGPQLSDIELANARVPFFSQQKANHHLGVGMYICKVICQTHGGSFMIRNVSNGVSTLARFNIE